MIDIDEYARRAVESPIAEPPRLDAVANLARRHRQRRMLFRTVVALAVVGVVGIGALAAISARDDRSKLDVRNSGPSPRHGSSTTAPTSTSTSGSTTASGPVNVSLTAAVQRELAVAFAAGRHMDVRFVAGIVSGSGHAAYDASTGIAWALADFSPSAAAQRAHDRLDGTPNDPFIEFQDGPIVLSRTNGSAWKFVTDTGGLVCPPRPPAAVLALWGVGGGADCH